MRFDRNMTTHRFLLRAALASGTVFAWILIFHALYYSGESKAGALVATTFLYCISQIITLTLTPFAAQNLGSGTQRSILYATLALAAGYMWLGASSTAVFGTDVTNLWWGTIGFAVLTGVYRAFYWIPYRASSSTEATGNNSSLEILTALLPLSASIIITNYESGAWFLLVGVSTLVFLAAIPLTKVQEAYEPFGWTIGETWIALFSKSNRRTLFESTLGGVQGAGLLFIWPFTIFLLLNWSYELLGLIITITMFSIILAKKIVRYLFGTSTRRSWRITTMVAALSWILRIVVFSPTSIIVADTLYHTLVPVRKFGIDHLAHEQAADSSRYVDETTALKEMGFSIGRALLSFTVLILAFIVSPMVALASGLAVAGASSVVAIIHDARERSPV